MKVFKLIVPVLAAVLAGCQTSYAWRSSVPEDMRSVAVPVFRNASDVTGLGSVVTRQVLREFQREGTFRIASSDDCAVEVVGELKKASSATVA